MKTVVRQRTGGSNPSSSADKESVSSDDTDSFSMSKGDMSRDLQQKGTVTNSHHQNQSKVSPDVSYNTQDEQENSKENSKEILSDPELSKLIDVWPGLSNTIRAGIMAMVQSSLNEERR